MKGFSVTGFLIILFSFSHVAKSQDRFRPIDSATYRLFAEKKWDSLIYTGKEAIRDGIDYYYLRLRMGVAEFQKQKYVKASQHLFKAATFNSSDPYLQEFLYYSCIYSNRPEEARVVTSLMTDHLKNDLRIKNPVVDQISAEGGMTLSSENSIRENPDLMKGDSIYGETDLYRDSYYAHIDLTLNLSPEINLNGGYNYLNFSKVKYFQYGTIVEKLDSVTQFPGGYTNHYTWSPGVVNDHFTYNVTQHEFYINSVISLSGRFSLRPFVHVVNVHSTNIQSSYNPQTVTDTIVYDGQALNPYVLYTYSKPGYTYVLKDTSFTDFVASLSLTKTFSIFETALAGSYSNLNNKRQFQLAGTVSYYPLGNLNLYGTTMVTGFFQGKNKRLIVGQVAGGKLFRRLWAEGSIVYGNLTNTNLNNGLVIYNNSDKIDYRIGADLYYILSKHIQIYLMYQYFEKENLSTYYIYDTTGSNNSHPKTEYKHYHTNSFIGGIKWKF